jgi:hypothetical protein
MDSLEILDGEPLARRRELLAQLAERIGAPMLRPVEQDADSPDRAAAASSW